MYPFFQNYNQNPFSAASTQVADMPPAAPLLQQPKKPPFDWRKPLQSLTGYDPQYGMRGAGRRVAGNMWDAMVTKPEEISRGVGQGIWDAGKYLFADPLQGPTAQPQQLPQAPDMGAQPNEEQWMQAGEQGQDFRAPTPSTMTQEAQPTYSPGEAMLPQQGSIADKYAQYKKENPQYYQGDGTGFSRPAGQPPASDFERIVRDIMGNTQSRIAAPQTPFKSPAGNLYGFDQSINEMHQRPAYQEGRRKEILETGNMEIQQALQAELAKYLPMEHLVGVRNTLSSGQDELTKSLGTIWPFMADGPDKEAMKAAYMQRVGVTTPQAPKTPTTPATPAAEGMSPLRTGVESAVPGFASGAAYFLPKLLRAPKPGLLGVLSSLVTAPLAQAGMNWLDPGLAEAQNENRLAAGAGAVTGALAGGKWAKGKPPIVKAKAAPAKMGNVGANAVKDPELGIVGKAEQGKMENWEPYEPNWITTPPAAAPAAASTAASTGFAKTGVTAAAKTPTSSATKKGATGTTKKGAKGKAQASKTTTPTTNDLNLYKTMLMSLGLPVEQAAKLDLATATATWMKHQKGQIPDLSKYIIAEQKPLGL